MESQELKVAIVQTNLVWKHPTEIRLQLDKKINAISEPIDIIVLPEMFTSGFTRWMEKHSLG